MGRYFMDYLRLFAKCPHWCLPERGLGPTHDREDIWGQDVENLKTLTLKFGERLLGVLLFVVPGLEGVRILSWSRGPYSKFCLGYLGLARHCYKGRGRRKGEENRGKRKAGRENWSFVGPEFGRGKEFTGPECFWGVVLAKPWLGSVYSEFRSSGLQNNEKRNVCCFKPVICDNLLQQPQKINSVSLIDCDQSAVLGHYSRNERRDVARSWNTAASCGICGKDLEMPQHQEIASSSTECTLPSHAIKGWGGGQQRGRQAPSLQ